MRGETCTRLRQVCLYFGLIVVSGEIDLSYCTRVRTGCKYIYFCKFFKPRRHTRGTATRAVRWPRYSYGTVLL